MTSTAMSTDTFRLSFAQERLWFAEQLDPGTSQFTIATALEVAGPLDQTHLRSALARLMNRHEIMRTRFVDRGEGPVQEVVGSVGVPLQVIHARPDDLDRLTGEYADTGFDLSSAPALRVGLVVLDTQRSVLLISMHHIICDGVSAEILLRDLCTLYASEVEARDPELPELDIQYGDFAEWQRDNVDETLVARQLDFWATELEGSDGHVTLPTDHPRPKEPDHVGGVVTAALPEQQAAALLELCRRAGVSPFMLLLACYEMALARAGGSRDFCIGTPSTGRPMEQVADVFGCFINVLPLRSDISDGIALGELLTRVRQRCLRAYTNADVPFERIVEHVAPQRESSRTPLFDVMLAVQVGRSTSTTAGDVTVRPRRMATRTAQYDLALDVRVDETGADLALGYATALLEESGARALLEQILRALADLLASTDRTLSDLPPVPAAGEADGQHCLQIMRSSLNTDDGRIRVTEDCQLYPGWLLWNTARSCGEALTRHGLAPGTGVSIVLRRGADRLAAALGAFLAGGYVVPPDPEISRSSPGHRTTDRDVTVITDEPDSFDGRVVAWSEVDGEKVAGEPEQAPPGRRNRLVWAEPGGPLKSAAAIAAEMETVARRLRDCEVVLMARSASVLEVMGALAANTRVVFADDDTAGILAGLHGYAADAAWLSQDAWTALLATGWQAPPGFRVISPQPLPSELTRRLAGAEHLPVSGYPLTPLETSMLDCFRCSLDRHDFGVHDDFFAFGGTSLSAARLVKELGAAADAQVPVRMLFSHPTVADLAAALTENVAGTSATTALEAARRDRVLPAEVHPSGQARSGAARRVLVAGATGLLGAHLVAELLTGGVAEVACLARAENDEHADRRMREVLARHRLGVNHARISGVAGDLEKPLLGLTERRFSDLADGLDAIFHCGAVTNFGLPYRVLSATNVGGTVELLRLACTGRPSAVHFVSTLDAWSGSRLLEDPVSIDTGAVEGYVLSKKVAEHLVLAAGERGLPVGVYRPGMITSSARTGATNQHDQVSLCLAGSLIAGVLPEQLPFGLHILPADQVASAIVSLARTTDAGHPIHQLFNDREIDMPEVTGHLEDMGYTLRVLPFEKWRAQVARHTPDSHTELASLLALDSGGASAPDYVETVNSARRLGGEPQWSNLDATYLRQAVEFLRDAGALPAPRSAEVR